MRLRRAPRRPPCFWGGAVRIVRLMAVAAALWFAAASAAVAQTSPQTWSETLSQNWPTRLITLVVPFTAGGTSDVIARLLAEGLRAQLGQPVLVENLAVPAAWSARAASPSRRRMA